MNSVEMIEQLKSMIMGTTRVPGLKNRGMVDLDSLMDLINELQNHLPIEIQECNEILKQKESIVKSAMMESSRIRDEVQKEMDSKREDAQKQAVGDPKILSPNKEYLNAATLGELIQIIHFVQSHSKEFDDVFEDWEKTKFYLQEAIALRNPRYHNDEQITWNEDMVTKTKAVTNEILVPIGKWFQR